MENFIGNSIDFSLQITKSLAQKTYISPLINVVNSNFNYGDANNAIKSYKKDARGIMAGATFQAGITPAFSVVAETYFVMKGATLKTENPLTVNKSTLRLYNAEIPVLARLHINHLYINAGPYVSYTIGGRIKTESSESIPEKSTAISFSNVTDGFKRWELGAQAGAGYNFRIKKRALALDLRYGYGLTNVSQDAERYNRIFTISIIAVKPWKKNPFAKKISS
ncbi:MAG: porin family protein [Segetibacter sp.]